MNITLRLSVLAGVLALSPAWAQSPGDAAAPAAPSEAAIPPADATAPQAAPAAAVAPEAPCCRLPQGTLVELEIGEIINSARHKRGDKFPLRLRSPIKVGDVVVVPAGTTGVGEIVHAMPARGGGKPGELLLAGRYLEFAGQQLPLRGLKVSTSGRDTYGLSLGLAYAVGPFAMFVRGHEIEVPAGTAVDAKLAQDTQFDAQALAAAAASAATKPAESPVSAAVDASAPTTPSPTADSNASDVSGSTQGTTHHQE
ncbi:cupin domain-containing protein [Agrilutibacter solisilvae]|uniref:Uncharacterized protein n=1 Tax=Agrilutibacter solisilvae TaxID=2763317 RepID=A0A974Y6B8_9GAMM|nr:hypothetical protein [Lysobacter solisilvae]QSX79516.1 hypothetical protein I8J32_006560 [Lysobacter solisilvae]